MNQLKVMDYLNQLESELHEIRIVQTEMSFLAKNFFFFIMGILFDFDRLDWGLLVTSFGLIGSIFVSRYLYIQRM